MPRKPRPLATLYAVRQGRQWMDYHASPGNIHTAELFRLKGEATICAREFLVDGEVVRIELHEAPASRRTKEKGGRK